MLDICGFTMSDYRKLLILRFMLQINVSNYHVIVALSICCTCFLCRSNKQKAPSPGKSIKAHLATFYLLFLNVFYTCIINLCDWQTFSFLVHICIQIAKSYCRPQITFYTVIIHKITVVINLQLWMKNESLFLTSC